MTAPARVTAGSTILINDLNQLIDLFEGASSMTEAFKFVSSSGENFIVKLADAAGVRKFQVQDSAGVEVAYITSDGDLVISGGFTPTGNLILPASTSPATVTDAAIQWDSDDNLIVVGDGASTQTFYPGTTKYKYKTTQQDFTTTTLATVTATSGNIAFAVLASTAYEIEVYGNMSAVGTAASGGFKWGFTFPASPTIARAQLDINFITAQGGAIIDAALINGNLYALADITSGTAFGGANRNDATTAGIAAGPFRVKFFLLNGTTAGTVTFQAAQNTAAGTSSLTNVVATMRRLIAE